MADELNDQHEPEVKSARGRRFLRLFLMVAGGLAAPCLALAAFFLSSPGGGDGPSAAKSGLVQSGRVATTTTTTRVKPAAPVTTTTTPLSFLPMLNTAFY